MIEERGSILAPVQKNEQTYKHAAVFKNFDPSGDLGHILKWNYDDPIEFHILNSNLTRTLSNHGLET